MKRLYRILIVIALVGSAFAMRAQSDGLVFSLLPQMPYNNYLNPGIRVPYNGIVGFGISNINCNVYNSSVRYTNIYKTINGEDVIDAAKFVNSLDDQGNFINMDFSMDIVNAGFRVKKWFFNIDWRMRMNTEFDYSRDFVGLFVFGNGHYLGADNPCDFNIGVDATMFSEIAVGAQYDVNDKLTVGIRPKLLGGIANVTVNNKDTKIYTDEDSYSISADVNIDIKAASVLESNIKRMKDITNIFKDDSINGGRMLDISENVGFGVDFGASYKINDKWSVAAGVYDLGYIKWTETKQKQKVSNGVVVNDAVFGSLDELTDMELDYSSMMDKVIDAVWGDDSLKKGPDYKTSLRTRIVLQGFYEMNPMVRFSAIGQLYKMKDGMKPAITLAYSGVYWDHLNFSLSYTLSKATGSAIGLGLGLHAGPFNIYAVADNILSMAKVASPVVDFATSYQTSGMRFGVVWTIGKYQNSDKDVKKADKKKKIDTDEIDKEVEEFKEKNSEELEEE